MKKIIFIILLLSTYSIAQENRLVRQNELSDSLDAVRTLIGTGDGSSVDTTSLSNRIDAKASNYEPAITGVITSDGIAPPVGYTDANLGAPTRQFNAAYIGTLYYQDLLYYNGVNSGHLSWAALNDNRVIAFPNKSGTIALLEDINSGGSVEGGLFETDGNGDLMPNDAILPDTYYELDGNGDIQPL